MTRVKVHITKEILEKSKNCGHKFEDNSGTNCAIALAVNDLLKYCYVDDTVIRCYPNANALKNFNRNKETLIKLPVKASAFISSFDRKVAVQRINMPEISFEIDIPDEALENIDISDVFENSQTLELCEKV